MASSQTSNYKLNQWAASDKFLRTEFNSDNSKIDAALKEAKEYRPYVVGTYTGNGTSGRVISLGFTPQAVIVKKPGNHETYYSNGETAYAPAIAVKGQSANTLNIVTNGFSVSTHQLVNGSGTVYQYIALR